MATDYEILASLIEIAEAYALRNMNPPHYGKITISIEAGKVVNIDDRNNTRITRDKDGKVFNGNSTAKTDSSNKKG